MDHSNESWIKVYTRDTASWRAVSLAARGLSLELSRNMGRFTDEISLGPRGLRAVAALVGASWDEVEPLLAELLADGRLEYDAERQTLRDPEHLGRQQSATSPAQRKRDQRRGGSNVTAGHAESRAVTPSHDQRDQREEIQERESRARDVAEAPEPEPEPPSRGVTNPPPWVEPTIAAIEMSTGEAFDLPVVWAKYQGTRERDGRAISAPDFRSFLASWASRQKQERIERAHRDATRPALSLVHRDSKPDTPPAPYHTLARPGPPEEPPASPEVALEAARRLAEAVGG